MKKPPIEEQFEELWSKIVGWVRKKYLPFPKKLFTHAEFKYALKMLEPHLVEVTAARALVTEELWSFYKLQGITDLPEQRIFEAAVEKLNKTIKEIGYEAPKEKPQKASKRVPLAKPKRGVQLPK